ncbi:MAG: Asp-tRNA(Asn)/Glu-tRNA(Gln) amidotransferase subunit GatA [Tissierellia bacterium]|nr:Asp-tRNA(Asn)/Glu-tRNA(Gln) amidotransferase subunit GatA [Tissierellia bacterium]
MELLDLKACEIPGLVKDKKVKALDITNAYLKHIEENDETLNAYITVTKQLALEQAKNVDAKVESGEDPGVLAGIPISLKDNISLKDVKMTCGSKMLEDYISPYDSKVAEIIKREGGIILGKVNLDEFAMGADTKTSYFGVTKNPLDPTRVAGGSSGGSASSVAGKEAILSVGTDTGGSVRQPSAFCGTVGMKPTYGSISRYGISPMANTFDTPGVIGRSVEDVLLLLQTLVGKDSHDATSLGNEALKELTLEDDVHLKGLKFALPSLYKNQELDEPIQESFDRVLALLEKSGAKVDIVEMDSLKYVIETYHILVNGEIAPNMSRFDGLRFGHRTKEYTTLEEMYMKSRSEAFGDEVKRRIMIGTHILSLDLSSEYYEKALKVRTMIRKEFETIFKDYDFVLSPTYPVIPYKVEEEMSPVEIYVADLFTVPVNLGNLCGISIPVENNSSLPGGVQIIGNHFKDHEVIKAAFAIERSLQQ